MSLLLTIIMVLGMFFMAGCSNNTSKELVVTVGDRKIYLDEAMFHIYATEAEMNSYDQYYMMMTGQGIWDMDAGNGKTMREQSKEQVMDQIIMTEILYMEGKKADHTITAEQSDELKASALEVLKTLPDEVRDITGLNEKVILNIYEKSYIGSAYSNSLVESFDIDEQGIKDGINYDDFRQYNTEFLSIPFTNYDEEGNQVELTEEEKLEAKDTIEEALEKAKNNEEFATIAEGYESIMNSPANFVYDSESMEKAYKDAAINLENDTITDEVIETESAYYIIKMVDNDSDESYNNAVNDAINQAIQEEFNTQYEAIKQNIKITINDKVWEPIVMGETTINLPGSETSEPTESENGDSTGDSTEPEDTDADTSGDSTEPEDTDADGNNESQSADGEDGDNTETSAE
jgi:foldase protein PrsA